jgi:acyl carrier protein
MEEKLLPLIIELMRSRFDNFDRMTAQLTITLDTTFAQDLRMESIDMVDLMIAVDTAFGIDSRQTDIHTFQTIGDLARYILSLNPGVV